MRKILSAVPTFLIERSIRYDIKGRKYIDTPTKYYFEDLGLRNARLNFRQAEKTHLMENLIYNELRLRGYAVDVGQVTVNTKNSEGKSERKQLEIDFVCNKGYDRIIHTIGLCATHCREARTRISFIETDQRQFPKGRHRRWTSANLSKR